MLHRYSLILPAPDADRGATGGLGTAADAPAPADDVKVVVRRVPPSVDRDGNELSGIRLPDVTVPLATYTGWNLRHPQIGAPERLMSLIGSTIPFPATEGQRAAKGDPRRSVAVRYPGKAAYLDEVSHAAQCLIDAGYLLPEDLERILAQSARRWDLLASAPESAAAQ